MKKYKWIIVVTIITIGFIYYSVSGSEITGSTACFSDEINKIQKEGK